LGRKGRRLDSKQLGDWIGRSIVRTAGEGLDPTSLRRERAQAGRRLFFSASAGAERAQPDRTGPLALQRGDELAQVEWYRQLKWVGHGREGAGGDTAPAHDPWPP